MRWERLFDDLESQLEAADRADFDAEVADRTRREVALTRLADRLRQAVGSRLDVSVEGAGTTHGVLRRTGAGWLLLEAATGHAFVVAIGAVRAVRGMSTAVAAPQPDSDVGSRLTLGYVLRGIARDRAPVVVVLRDGSQYDGRIDRVAADFFDLAGGWTVSIDRLAVVRTG